MATATRQYSLTRIYDVREYDAWQQDYIPCAEEEKHICEQCGRRHNKVYVIEERESGRLFFVGSGCCQKYLSWEPSTEEVKAVKLRETREKKRAQKEAIEEKAACLIKELRARLPGRNTWELKVTVAQDIINSYEGLSEAQKGKVWAIAKKSL